MLYASSIMTRDVVTVRPKGTVGHTRPPAFENASSAPRQSPTPIGAAHHSTAAHVQTARFERRSESGRGVATTFGKALIRPE